MKYEVRARFPLRADNRKQELTELIGREPYPTGASLVIRELSWEAKDADEAEIILVKLRTQPDVTACCVPMSDEDQAP